MIMAINQTPLLMEGDTFVIHVNKGYSTIVDSIDADLIKYKWNPHREKYAIRYTTTRGKSHGVFIHRIILERKLGRGLTSGEFVDHINGVGFDNRRCNLRLASMSENNRNVGKRSNNTSGYKGISRDHNFWRAEIRVNGKKIYLGIYSTKEDAYAAYCEASKKYHGEFGRLE